MPYEKIEVGLPFEIKNKTVPGDGTIFQSMGDGIWLQAIYFTNISPYEVECIRIGDIKFRFIKEGDFLLPLVRYNTEVVFELAFDPTLYLSKEVYLDFESMTAANTMATVLIDSQTNLVVAIRAHSIPSKLFSTMKEVYQKAFLIEGFSEKYKHWVSNLRRKDVFELWEIAESGYWD